VTQPGYDISVVICAYTEERWHDLVEAIESVQRQTLPPREIIVVIDRNPNLLKRVQEHAPGVMVIENQAAKGLSGARNSGVAVAQGTVVAFLDDDAVAEPDWLESLLDCYTDSDVVGVGGKIEPLWLKLRPCWFPDEFNWVVGCTYRGMPTKKTAVRNVIGANMSVRRSVITAVGAFRESFGCNHNDSQSAKYAKWFHHHAGDEETEFCIRVAQHSPSSVWLYTPYAPVRHRVPAQRACWAYFLWRCYDEGLGKAMLVQLHGAQTGLSSERRYTSRVLPQGIMHGLHDALFHGDLTGLARAGAIVMGLMMTIVGYVVESLFSQVTRLRNSAMALAGSRNNPNAPPSIKAQQ
jgi:glycosyltransferase involved in cell wall biosynthesis